MRNASYFRFFCCWLNVRLVVKFLSKLPSANLTKTYRPHCALPIDHLALQQLSYLRIKWCKMSNFSTLHKRAEFFMYLSAKDFFLVLWFVKSFYEIYATLAQFTMCWNPQNGSNWIVDRSTAWDFTVCRYS